MTRHESRTVGLAALREYAIKTTADLSDQQKANLFTVLYGLKKEKIFLAMGGYGYCRRGSFEDWLAETNCRLSGHSRGFLEAIKTIPEFNKISGIVYEEEEDDPGKKILLVDERGPGFITAVDVNESMIKASALQAFINSGEHDLEVVFEMPGFDSRMYYDLLLAFDPDQEKLARAEGVVD